MRKAFTLLELLTIVAIIGIMAAVGVSSLSSGQGAARVRGAARDIFGTIRQARSTALVTGQPCVISYSTVQVDGETCAKVEIDGTKMFGRSNVTKAETLSGEIVDLSGGESEGEGGETIEDILFAPISSDVVKGIAIKVVQEGEELESTGAEEGRKKSMISSYSNVDALLGLYKQSSSPAKETGEDSNAESEGASEISTAGDDMQERVSIVWETNGRTKPHKVYIYKAGKSPDSGLVVTVDMFGAMKVKSPGEEDD